MAANTFEGQILVPESPSLQGDELYVGIRKANHMLVVSLGVYNMSHLVKVSFVATSSRLYFLGVVVRVHLAFVDILILLEGKRQHIFSWDVTEM